MSAEEPKTKEQKIFKRFFFKPTFCKRRENKKGGGLLKGGANSSKSLVNITIEQNEGITGYILNKRLDKTKSSNLERKKVLKNNEGFASKLIHCLPPDITYNNVEENLDSLDSAVTHIKWKEQSGDGGSTFVDFYIDNEEKSISIEDFFYEVKGREDIKTNLKNPGEYWSSSGKAGAKEATGVETSGVEAEGAQANVQTRGATLGLGDSTVSIPDILNIIDNFRKSVKQKGVPIPNNENILEAFASGNIKFSEEQKGNLFVNIDNDIPPLAFICKILTIMFSYNLEDKEPAAKLEIFKKYKLITEKLKKVLLECKYEIIPINRAGLKIDNPADPYYYDSESEAEEELITEEELLGRINGTSEIIDIHINSLEGDTSSVVHCGDNINLSILGMNLIYYYIRRNNILYLNIDCDAHGSGSNVSAGRNTQDTYWANWPGTFIVRTLGGLGGGGKKNKKNKSRSRKSKSKFRTKKGKYNRKRRTKRSKGSRN